MDELRKKIVELAGWELVNYDGCWSDGTITDFAPPYLDNNLMDRLVRKLSQDKLEQFCINLRNTVHPGIENRDLESTSFTLYGSVTCGYKTLIMKMITATVEQKARAYIATMEE